MGVIPQNQTPVTAAFCTEGDDIVLLGETASDLGGSAYLRVIHKLKMGMPPQLDLTQERAVQQVVIRAAEKGWLSSAHDCSDGGLAVALAECCILNEQQMFGAHVDGEAFHAAALRLDELLFGESPSRIVVSCNSSARVGLQHLAEEVGVHCRVIGEVRGNTLSITPWVEVPIAVLSAAYHQSLPQYLDT